jgi:hypothetical protein
MRRLVICLVNCPRLCSFALCVLREKEVEIISNVIPKRS